MVVCDKVCLGVSTSPPPLISVNLSWLMKLPRWDSRQLSSYERIWLGILKKFRESPLPAFAVFQVALSQNNQYTPKCHISGQHALNSFTVFFLKLEVKRHWDTSGIATWEVWATFETVECDGRRSGTGDAKGLPGSSEVPFKLRNSILAHHIDIKGRNSV